MRSPSLDDEHVAGHELAPRRQPCGGAVAQHRGAVGQVAGERLDRPLGLLLLDEGEGRVEDDDDDDRDGDGDDAGDPRQRGRRPQQQREGVGELVRRARGGQRRPRRRSSTLGPNWTQPPLRLAR